jgi:phosphoribosylaminoimidazolecarboxamide formyltransferase / IMP cyclohydrolase
LISARDIASDEKDLQEQGISPISIVVCNLYPFTSTISKPGCTLADASDEITLLRAAAKNHQHVSVLSDPADYKEFLESLIKGQGDVGQSLRSKLALKAFEMTAQYDEAISGYFREQYASAELSEEQLAGKLPFKGKIRRTPSCVFLSNR